MTLFKQEEVMDRASVAPEPGSWTGHHQGTVSDTEDGGLRPEARVLHSEVSQARDPIDLATSVAEEEARRRRVAASTESAHTLAQRALKGMGDASEQAKESGSEPALERRAAAALALRLDNKDGAIAAPPPRAAAASGEASVTRHGNRRALHCA